MNEPLVDLALERALALPPETGLLAFTGDPGTGKTAALVRRFSALAAADAELAGAAIVTAARPDGAVTLAKRITAACGVAVRGMTLDALAFELLRADPLASGLALDLECIAPYDADEIFERAAAPLFSAEWSDFLGPDLDPEIAGLRTPDRFAAAALRLIRKLRDAGISDETFLAQCRKGATEFYATPPNLASPQLLAATKDEHRGSLAVDATELERQRKRELDLAKALARLYRAYVDALVAHGCLTASDALVEATRLLDETPALARATRRTLRVAFVDDAHDLAPEALRFLRALFGDALAGVAIAGDPDAATRTFAGARPERLFGRASTTVRLEHSVLPPAIATAVRAVIDADPARRLPREGPVEVVRCADRTSEAAEVAAHVAALLAKGVPAGEIAVLHRTLRTLAPYEDALVDRDVPIALAGDPALLLRPDVLDALALIWLAVDPFAHAWTLRALQTPAIRLSDASLAMLCGEPASPQPALFALPDEAETDRRWDRKRDLRLGTNLLRGERDADLSPLARERVVALRERRRTWSAWLHEVGIADAARAIVTDGGLLLARPDETAARRARRAQLLDALFAFLAHAARRRPYDDAATLLGYVARVAELESGPEIVPSAGGVTVAAIDRVLHRRFAHVVMVDARAGAFPPYYVPDAFLFSPTYGMIPKDSAGGECAARTAKFTWYEHQAKPRATYVKEQRRLFALGLARATTSVLVTASGRATRGSAAPELAAELASLIGA